MFCMYCGTKNEDDYCYCKNCGKPLKSVPDEETLDKQPMELVPVDKEKREEDTTNRTVHHSTTASPPKICCPKCGAESGSCLSINKATTKTTGSNYNAGSGCCGMILLGPFGLLCGLCGAGKNTTTQNQTWWVCQQCGAEFQAKK